MCERAGVQAGFINHTLCLIKLRTKMHVQSCVPLPLLQVPRGTVACSRTCVHVRERGSEWGERGDLVLQDHPPHPDGKLLV